MKQYWVLWYHWEMQEPWKDPELYFRKSEMAPQGTEFTEELKVADSVCAV